jgi:hypothetical protein
MATFDSLWHAFEQALGEPTDDLATAIHALPDVGRLPSPWATWTLIGLVRHRRRQLWVGQVVATRLQGELESIARMGAFGHPEDIPQHGLVPGLTDWEYFFHGGGCCLTHRGSGEAIDVDFFGETAEYFDIFFYLNYLKSLKDPEPPEARLMALHSSFKPIRLVVGELLDSGMLTPLEDREYPFRISEDVLAHEDAIDGFCESWGNPDRRLWLATSVGDWIHAHELALITGDRDLIELTTRRAVACKSSRCRELLGHWEDESKRSNVLLALDDLAAEELREQLDLALGGPIGGVTSTALEIIQRHDDPVWCDAVFRVFRRLDPSGELPEPFLWVRCQEFLLHHGYRAREMRASLVDADGIAVGEAALLALEYDPRGALPLFRRALRSNIPMNRTAAAATLTLIDRPWSRRELLAVLRESNDQEATAACRAALLECHDVDAHTAVLSWEEANPHESETGRFISMKEMMLRHSSSQLRYEMEQRHDRVMNVRDREPVEAGAERVGILRWFRERLSRWM